jgi:hypothetical protein
MNISPDIYSLIYYIVLIFAVIIVFVDANTDLFYKYRNSFKYFQFFFVAFCVLLIGFRPAGANGYLDTKMYIDLFQYTKENHELEYPKDMGFDYSMLFTSYFLNYRGFFLLCSLTSFVILFFTSKIINQKSWFLFFLATCSSLYFFDYQVYTIRQGLACAFALLAFVHPKKYIKIPFLIASVLFHKSLLLPVIGYLGCSLIYNGTLLYVIMWICSIPISYFSGHWWEFFFAKFLKNDERTLYLTKFSTNSTWLLRTGFRVDILLFNFLFVLVGIYYIWILKINDKVYQTIFNVYLVCNVIIILVIRANNIHRFAYLVWFLIPVLLLYPLLIKENDTTQKTRTNTLNTEAKKKKNTHRP